jgi:hypothetical protein
MASSRIPGPLNPAFRPGTLPARTPGPLGYLDQGDPTASGLLGDTPGPLGWGDGAATRQRAPATGIKPEKVQRDDSARLRAIRKLVEENNRSELGVDVLICQIYMESRFDARAGTDHDARGLMQMQKQAVQQVFKYRKQKELGHMPSDKQTKTAFAEAAAIHHSERIFDEAINIQLGTEYMQYWIDTSPSVADAYKRYRGLANGIYYRKISACAAQLTARPDSISLLREMVK